MKQLKLITTGLIITVFASAASANCMQRPSKGGMFAKTVASSSVVAKQAKLQKTTR